MAPRKDEDLGDPYELLGVEFEAADKDIQTAYRKAALKCHPDKVTDPDEKAEASAKFEKLTRAKDLLLDPVKRAEVDRDRKAREELQHRFAQEDSKRRKLREDLEGRESAAEKERGAAAARGGASAESAEDARVRFVQSDFAARIKAREAERAGRQADLVATAEAARTQSKSDTEAARVRVTWRDGAAVTLEAIKEVLSKFELQSLEMGECSATAVLGSREEALRAVLHCRERKHTMPFRVSIATAKRPEEAPGSARAKGPATAGADGKAKPKPAAAAKFADYEKDMLSGLLGLAAAQRNKRKEA